MAGVRRLTMKYSDKMEREMKVFYDTLSEKDRRRYAAVEAAKLGHGGIEYIATELGCAPQTIGRGRHEWAHLPPETRDRIRKKGGAVSRA